MDKDDQVSLLKIIAKHTRDLHLFMADQNRLEEQRVAEIRTATEREKRLLKRLDKMRFWLIVIAFIPIVSFVLGLFSGTLAIVGSMMSFE